ncbi:hypothetical protein BCR39DRAFT_529234 [Naematelia encephala]|uniref:Large ribosomal subunit protein uL23m n=1 Tax=Naematelia encephala TaxID=71784 RepID=A0A1Y2B6H9_9TREE|nr:hypothetical protein BCR39DRAFT_529234 [Naematelia encephala]
MSRLVLRRAFASLAPSYRAAAVTSTRAASSSSNTPSADISHAENVAESSSSPSGPSMTPEATDWVRPAPSSFASSASARRTIPQRVARRRAEFPSHPLLSPSPLSDPELVSPSADSKKQLPMKMRLELDRYREQGLFTGDIKKAQVEYLEAISLWRSRIRGWVIEELASEDSDATRTYRATLRKRRLEGEVHTRASIDLFKTEEEVSGRPWVDCTKSHFMRHFCGQPSAWVDDPTRFPEPVADPQVRRSLVATRIYLPNIIVKLVRNYTRPGEAYDPYVATFRLPLSMTKTDLRSYLKAVYDLDVTFIRTDIHYGELTRNKRGQWIRQKGAKYNYKRAIVGLHEPFHYPDDVEELAAQGKAAGQGTKWAEARRKALNDTFYLEDQAKDRRRTYLRVYRGTRKFRDPQQGENAGHVVRAIMERRKQREELIKLEAVKLRGITIPEKDAVPA